MNIDEIKNKNIKKFLIENHFELYEFKLKENLDLSLTIEDKNNSVLSILQIFNNLIVYIDGVYYETYHKRICFSDKGNKVLKWVISKG